MSTAQPSDSTGSTAPIGGAARPFVISLPDPSVYGRRIEISIVDAEAHDIEFWCTYIQPKLLSANRFDAKWDWRALFKPTSTKNKVLRHIVQSPKLFVIRATSVSGSEVPIGLMYLVLKYPSPYRSGATHPFISYISKADSAFIREHCEGPVEAMLAFIDTAIQQSRLSGYGGEIALHSDIKGGEDLQNRYRKLGLKGVLAKNANLTFARVMLLMKQRLQILGRSEDWYFFADIAAANAISDQADPLREPISELQ